jgi:hypothetical protein
MGSIAGVSAVFIQIFIFHRVAKRFGLKGCYQLGSV